MSDFALRIRELGKRYQLGQRAPLIATLLQNAYRKVVPRKPCADEEAAAIPAVERPDFWALRNVTTEIRRGDVVGVIGRNGSGKSTLLKILSRITPPTEGEVEVRGRLGSLLEVGTGFHPELTGRENIYLNGVLLGMTRAEINRKLDDILGFAGIEKFVDTPVKRYSSGMSVRLAFSVAAQLESEILILDEVLTVGDQAFQRRCLGKVGEVARSGRTVLVVSHNLPILQNVCNRGLLLKDGQVHLDDKIASVVRRYVEMDQQSKGERIWDDSSRAPRFEDGCVSFRAIRALNHEGVPESSFDVNDSIEIEIEYEVHQAKHAASLHLYFRTQLGECVFCTMDNAFTPYKMTPQSRGVHRARCRVPAGLLSEGVFHVELVICTHPSSTNYASERDVLVLTIVDEMLPSKVRHDWDREWPASLVRPYLEWSFDERSRSALAA